MMEFLATFWNGIVSGAAAFWNDVLTPLGSAIPAWIETYVPICKNFANFCFDFFKLRYSLRVYSLLLVVPFFLFASVIFFFRRRAKRARMRRLQRRYFKEAKGGAV